MAKKKKNAGARPIQNRALVNAIAAFKEQPSKENNDNLMKEVMKAKLLAPVLFNTEIKPDARGKVRISGDTAVSFLMVNTNSGKTFLPVFTEIEEAKKLQVNQSGTVQYVVRALTDYENVLGDARNKAEGIVINPMHENIVLPKPLVMALIKGEDLEKLQSSAPRPAVPNIPAHYSEPRIYPTALANAVYEFCLGKPEISRVWLRQQTAGTQNAFALVVDADKKDGEMLSAMQACAQEFSREVPVVVMSYDPSMEKNVIQDTVPLYDRELEID